MRRGDLLFVVGGDEDGAAGGSSRERRREARARAAGSAGGARSATCGVPAQLGLAKSGRQHDARGDERDPSDPAQERATR